MELFRSSTTGSKSKENHIMVRFHSSIIKGRLLSVAKRAVFAVAVAAVVGPSAPAIATCPFVVTASPCFTSVGLSWPAQTAIGYRVLRGTTSGSEAPINEHKRLSRRLTRQHAELGGNDNRLPVELHRHQRVCGRG